MLARLERATSNRFEWYASMLFLVVTASSFLVPGALYLHECWAMTLILLSLAVRTDRRWWPAVVFGVAAVMFRETALVYLGTMAAVALFQKRWSEVAAGRAAAWRGSGSTCGTSTRWLWRRSRLRCRRRHGWRSAAGRSS
jgi:hypothetical protein